MFDRITIGKTVKSAMWPIAFLSLTGYFLWSTFEGGHGLRAYHEHLKLAATANQDYKEAENENKAWHRRIDAMRLQHLDLDALDENVRWRAYRADPNEIILKYPPGEKLYQDPFVHLKDKNLVMPPPSAIAR